MTKGYAIDFITNTVTVTKQFLRNSEVIDSVEFGLMLRFRELNLSIITKPSTPKKKTRITYAMMLKYIALLEESDKYKAEFDVVRAESKTTPNPYNYVLTWFKHTFASYGKIPERDQNFKII